jgi:hypothetical protein
MKDIYYVAEKHSHLLKTNAKSLRNVVRAALSDYRNLFQSFGHGLWGFCVDSTPTEEAAQRRNTPAKQKFEKMDSPVEPRNKRTRASQDILARIPLSPDLTLPKPETEGIFLCWEGESKFRLAMFPFYTASTFSLSSFSFFIVFPFPHLLIIFLFPAGSFLLSLTKLYRSCATKSSHMMC